MYKIHSTVFSFQYYGAPSIYQAFFSTIQGFSTAQEQTKPCPKKLTCQLEVIKKKKKLYKYKACHMVLSAMTKKLSWVK